MEEPKKHSLGQRAFLLFFFRRIKPVVIWGLIGGAVWWSEQWVPAYATWIDYAAKLILLIAGAFLLFALAQALLEYRYYKYMFTNEAFVMTYGYIMRNEVAALYHQIQNVNIRRGPLHRLAGVSELVIFMSGSDKDAIHNKIILPALGKTKAKLVQKELLVRARKHVGTMNT